MTFCRALCRFSGDTGCRRRIPSDTAQRRTNACPFRGVEKRFHKQFVVTAGRHRAANHSQNAPPFSCRWTEHVCRNNAHVIGPKSFPGTGDKFAHSHEFCVTSCCKARWFRFVRKCSCSEEAFRKTERSGTQRRRRHASRPRCAWWFSMQVATLLPHDDQKPARVG